MAVYQASYGISWTYGSSRLFHIACTASQRSKESEDDVLVAILFSVAALEALVSDVACVASLPAVHGQRDVVCEQLKSQLNEQSTVEPGNIFELSRKIKAYFRITTGRDDVLGRQPFQDLSLLVALRNAIVHHVPEKTVLVAGVRDRDDDSEMLLKRLEARQIIKLNADDAERRWTSIISTYNVALWAASTAAQVGREMSAAAPVDSMACTSIVYLCERFCIALEEAKMDP
jgi:hypothetical protein